MKKLLVLTVFLAGIASAQWSDFSLVTGSTNLSGAINGKISVSTGSGAPNGACHAWADAYYKTDGTQYYCGADSAWHVSLTVGPSGPSGPQGTVGNTGGIGPSGPSGPNGASVTGPSGPSGPSGATGLTGSGVQGPVVNRAVSFTIDCTNDNLTTEAITAGSVVVTIPACGANNVQFWVINTQLGNPTYTLSGSTVNGGSTLNALPVCVATAGCTGYKFLQNPGTASDWRVVTTTGTAGTNGTNGASGPSGPSGPAGAVGPSGPAGSGASTIDFQGGTSNLAESGSFVTVYSTTVTSLAAGSCFEVQSNAVATLANGGDYKIFVDAVQIAEPFNGATDISFRLMHCNNHGVQNAQTSFYSLATLTYSGGTVSASTPAYGTPGTSAIDWTTSHVLTLQVKAASGTVSGKYWAVR